MANNKYIWFKNWVSPNIRHLIRCKKIYATHSKFQKIEIMDSAIFGRMLVLDNEIQIASQFNSYVHESLIHPAILCNPLTENVLIIGGGDGFAIGEVLKYPSVKSIDLVELDKEVVAVCKRFFPEVNQYFDNKKVSLHFEDGYDFVEMKKRCYDVIILDISDPKGEATKIFSYEFLINLKNALKPNGLVITHCESPNSAGLIYYRIIKTYQAVFKKVRLFRVWVPHYADFWGRLVASDYADPKKLTESQIRRRINTLRIKLKWLTPELFYSIFRSISRDILLELNKNYRIIRKKDKVFFHRP